MSNELKIISNKGKTDERTLTVEGPDLGTDLQSARDLHGDDVVFARYKADAVVGFQGYIRGLMKALDKEGNLKHTDEDIIEKATEYKPSAKQGRTSDPGAKLEKSLEDMASKNPEALRAILVKAGLLPAEVGEEEIDDDEE